MINMALVKCSENASSSFKKNKILPFFDTLGIIRLYSSIIKENALTIQVKVNRFISQKTHAQNSFLIFPSEDYFILQVINEIILSHPVKISGASKYLSTIASKGQQSADKQSDKFGLILQKTLGINVEFHVLIPIFLYESRRDCYFFVCMVNKEIKKISFPMKNNLSIISRNNYSIEISEFLPEDKDFVQDLLKTLGLIMFRNVFRNRSKYLKNIVKVIKRIEPYLENHQDLLKTIMFETGKCIKAELCVLHELKEDFFYSTIYYKKSKTEFMKQQIVYYAEDVILDHVLNKRRPSHIRPNKNVTRYDIIMHQILCVPIIYRERLLGILEFCNRKTGFCFSLSNEEFTAMVATFCSYILQSMSIYENKKVEKS